MSPTTHKNPNNEERRATAPYNFVRLPEKVLQPPADEDSTLDQSSFSGYSGSITLKLESSSPVYIRGMMTTEQYRRLGKKDELSDQEKEELSPFFSLNNQYRIPGSTMRGLFRSLFEIITYSKPLFVNEDHFIYRSVESNNHGEKYRNRLHEQDPGGRNRFQPKYLAGYMRNVGGKWYIQQAKVIGGATFARVSHNLLSAKINNWRRTDRQKPDVQLVHHQTVFVRNGNLEYRTVHGFIEIEYIRVEDISTDKKESEGITQEGTLITSGPMNSKRSEAVIFPKDSTKKKEDWVKIPDDLLKSYEVPKFRNVNLARESGVKQDGHPVFYLLNDSGELVAFNHCPMIRIPYLNSPKDLVEKDLGKSSEPDMAERVFGYVDRENYTEASRAGRLAFCDALIIPGVEQPVENNDAPIAPKILASPKPTNFTHYLSQTRPDDQNQLLDYDDNTSIRGSKFYWARNESPEYKETNVNNLNKNYKQYTRIKPLKKGNEFSTQIKFDNLTLAEMGALLWIIKIGRDEKYRLRVGMGKPYGLGAIKIKEMELKLIDRKTRYQKLLNNDEEHFLWNLGDKYSVEESREIEKSALKAYETWILSDNEINPENKTSVYGLPRVQELLALLSWPGPDPSKTEYITVPKEFGYRKVLPTPIAEHFTPLHGTPKAQKDTNLTVTAIILDAESDPIECEVPEFGENTFGQIASRFKKKFSFKDDEKYICNVLNERKEGDDTILTLIPRKRSM